MSKNFEFHYDIKPNVMKVINKDTLQDRGSDLAGDDGIDLNEKNNYDRMSKNIGSRIIAMGLIPFSSGAGDPEGFDRILDNQNRLNTPIGSDYADHCDPPKGFEENQRLIREIQDGIKDEIPNIEEREEPRIENTTTEKDKID